MPNLQNVDLAHDEATMKGMYAIQFMAKKLQEAQDNPYLCDVVIA